MGIKKVNEVTSEEVLAWARRLEAQMVQRARIRATNESKEFHTVKKPKEQYIKHSKCRQKKTSYQM